MKGIRALEYVGRETLDILAAETGFELENDEKLIEEEGNGGGESFTEDVTFDRCFYIYGGPEHLEVRSPIISETLSKLSPRKDFLLTIVLKTHSQLRSK